MNDDFRNEIASKISDEQINDLKGYLLGADDWENPCPNDLVALAELHNLLLMRGFVTDTPARFDLLDVGEMLGLTPHQMTVYADIGNWLAMDRRFSEMDDDEVEDFYSSMDELVTSMAEDDEISDIFTTSLASVAERMDEIAELNNLFYQE
jgi:hypothetical protein